MMDDSSRHSLWLAIPLEDYERHMSADSVAQAGMLAETLRRLVQAYRPGSFALLGSAGGNGLESLDPAMTLRVVAVDVNAAYLQECSARHAARFDRFEAVHCDLSQGPPFADPVELVYAALVVEYLELDAFLSYVSSLVTQGGRIAFVFQDRDGSDTPVSDSGVRSIQLLKSAHEPVDLARVVDVLQARGDGCRGAAGSCIRAGKALYAAGDGEALSCAQPVQIRCARRRGSGAGRASRAGRASSAGGGLGP